MRAVGLLHRAQAAAGIREGGEPAGRVLDRGEIAAAIAEGGEVVVVVGDRRHLVGAVVTVGDVLVIEVDRGRLVAPRAERDLGAVGERVGVRAVGFFTSVSNWPGGLV